MGCACHGHKHDHNEEQGKSWLYRNTGPLLYATMIIGLLAQDLIKAYYKMDEYQQVAPIKKDSELIKILNHTH